MATYEMADSKSKNYIVHPYRFNLWLFILTVVMVFGGLTSAYIVARSTINPEDWVIFDLPSILWTNLAVIAISSVTMQFSVWSQKRQDSRMALIFLAATFILGVVFLIGQFRGWEIMTGSGLPFVDAARRDNSVSFFYVFTGLHGLHIVGALIALMVVGLRLVTGKMKPENRKLSLDITATFWHFLGLLWVYLFVFLIYTQN